MPLESDLLVHVFSALSMHHGPSSLETASAVCRRWHERVAGAAQLDEDPDNLIGELRSGDKPHRFDRPHDALFLPSGDICVADCDNFRLQVVSREGYYIREVSLSGGTSCPTGVADGDNYLFVVEHGAHQISKLRKSSSSGHRHAVAGSWGGGDGELRHPWGAAVAGKRVWVTDQGNDRVSVFEADKLKWLFSFGGSGAKPGELSSPRGLCAHAATNELFVCDFRNHRVQVFSMKDADKAKCPPVRIIGGGGGALGSATAGRFNGPSGGTSRFPSLRLELQRLIRWACLPGCVATHASRRSPWPPLATHARARSNHHRAHRPSPNAFTPSALVHAIYLTCCCPNPPVVELSPLPAVCISGKAGDEKLFVAEVGGQRLQVLSLSGLPLQLVTGFGPLSGVACDNEHCCVTSLEGDSALVLLRVLPPPPSIELMKSGGKAAAVEEAEDATAVAASPAPGACTSGCLDPCAGIHHKNCPNTGKVMVVDPKSAVGAVKAVDRIPKSALASYALNPRRSSISPAP